LHGEQKFNVFPANRHRYEADGQRDIDALLSGLLP
jgi:hypothetical protein